MTSKSHVKSERHTRRRVKAGLRAATKSTEPLDGIELVVGNGRASVLDVGSDNRAGNGAMQTFAPPSSRTIFDYFDFKKGEGRDKLLRKYDGNPLTGLEIFRQAYYLGRFYGLIGTFEKTPNDSRRNLIALANYIHQHGMQEADSFVEAASINAIRYLTDHKQIQIGDKMGWVPSRDIDAMVKEIGTEALRHPTAAPLMIASLMRKRGYSERVVDGVTIYSK